MSERLRIFISSPSDVQEERLRAHLVVQKLARDYARFFQIESYLWEYEPMLASGHFQDAIEPPSASDVVVLIVYSRLGTSLPERSGEREYRGIDGRAPVTGTEWEFEEALEAHRAHGAPDLLAYRKLGDPGASLADSAKRAEQARQWDALEAFWRRHFEAGTLFLAGSAKFQTLDEFDQKLESDLVALIERRIADGLAGGHGTPEATWFKGSPFRGLASYDVADAPIFFGRDAQTRSALTRLQGAAERGHAFLLILGASGSGKSSLARAGVLPGLFAPKAIPGVAIWRRVILRPGDADPVLGLARALCATDQTGEVGLPELGSSEAEIGQLAAHLAASADDPSYPFRAALDRVAAEARRKKGLLPHETARLVILVDQMEELLTRRIDAARRELFVRILAGLARSGVVWVVATMRNDLWHRAVEVPQLVALVEAGARLDLARPDASQIIEIIRRPAAAAGLTFETDGESGIGLDAVMARAASEEPGALPLLSVMLEALYERDVVAASREGHAARKLRVATYRGLGELKGAIAQRADEILAAVAATDPEAAASFPRVLRALVTASALVDTITSRPARLDQFADGSPEARLVAALLAPDARLLVASNAEGAAEIRLAHEALIDNWPKARDQIALDRRDLETRTRLEGLLQRWKQGGADQARALLTGLNLAEGADLVRRWGADATGGLGAFVRASAQADAWRRRRTLVAASVLVCVFAAIAGLAALQWRRAESQTEVARLAQETEKSARIVAESERARATDNEQRANVALRATKLQTAQTLAAQVPLAIDQKDIRRAVSLAVEAGETEKDVLGPDGRAASEPALLQALAEAREVLNIKGASQNWWLPYGFLDDATLVYADSHAGLVVVDLKQAPEIAARVPLPGDKQATNLAVFPERGIVAVSLDKDLLLIDARSRQILSTLTLPSRINAIDIDPAHHALVVAAGPAIGIIDLDHPALPTMVSVPDVRAGANVGQVRFAQAGAVVLASYGTKVLPFTVASQSFAAPVGELSGAGLGVDSATLDAAIGNGMVAFVHLFPDVGTSQRFFTFAPLALQTTEPVAGGMQPLRGDDPRAEFVGMSQTDQERTGRATATVAVLARNDDDRMQLELRYVSGVDGLVAKDGQLYRAFESFAVTPGDFDNQKPDSCIVSANISFLACQYVKKEAQGIVVWRVLGGNHRFERIAERPNASSAVSSSANGPLLVSAKGRLLSIAGGVETKLADLPDGWTLAATDGPFVVAVSTAEKKGQVLRFDNAQKLTPVLGPIPATGVSIIPGTARALVQEADRLSVVEIETGRSLWSAPIAALGHVELSKDSRQVMAVAATAAYAFEIDTGRLLGSYPLTLAPDGPVAIDPVAGRVAYLDAGKTVTILDLASGAAEKVETIATPTQFAWSRDGNLLLIGGSDGSVLAWERAKGRKWLVPSPFAKSFQASAWPGQPPQGVVLQIALSNDGRRFAIIRQDMAPIGIYDIADGRQLTELTPPWTTLSVPAHVAFAANDDIVSTWALHAMTRDKPSYVTVHRLPRNFDEALAAASARRTALGAVWTPEGPTPIPAN